LIKKRLEENSELKVIIISHPKFIKEDPKKGIRNISLISELQGNYPARFSVVYSDDIAINGGQDGFKKVTNHTKYTGIDFGRYYIMGGSAIKDNFDLSGVDSPFELLEKKLLDDFALLNERLTKIKDDWEDTTTDVMCSWIKDAEVFSQKLRQSPHYSPKDFTLFFEFLHKNIGLLTESQENPSLCTDKRDQLVVNVFQDTAKTDAVDSGIVGFLVPGNFRDMDFVFKDPNDGQSNGRQLFLEAVRLAYRWEALNEGRDEDSKVPVYTRENIANLPIFTGAKAEDVRSENTVVQRIMKEPMPLVTTLKTSEVEGFEGVEKGSIEMIYQGPESPTGRSSIAQKALNLISNAKDKIVFNHMYFAPTEEIVLALKDAAERGVKIEIITTAVTKNCPNGQLAFGPYNRWHWSYLVAKVAPEFQKNIEIYAYQQNKKGLHKKVIVVDDTVLAGSSNFGYKSLVTSSDHEFNFLAKSQLFAERTLAICEEDKARSIKIEGNMGFSPLKYITAWIYSLN
ncbi:MAG: hypothetical protein HRU43_06830, partial [Simkaniaceae bacterium]|nr:hypothetical protein [Simkaniaceae bacterium]